MRPLHVEPRRRRELDAGHRSLLVANIELGHRGLAADRRASLVAPGNLHGHIDIDSPAHARRCRQVGLVRHQLGGLQGDADVGGSADSRHRPCPRRAAHRRPAAADPLATAEGRASGQPTPFTVALIRDTSSWAAGATASSRQTTEPSCDDDLSDLDRDCEACGATRSSPSFGRRPCAGPVGVPDAPPPSSNGADAWRRRPDGALAESRDLKSAWRENGRSGRARPVADGLVDEQALDEECAPASAPPGPRLPGAALLPASAPRRPRPDS